MTLGRWSNFTLIELIVINEALNSAFVGSTEGSWDEEAQRIAATIPPCEDKQIIDRLNEP